MKGIKIKSIGAYAPSLIVSNDHLSEIVDTSDEWIRERTGIIERRITTGEDTSEIATQAAKMALDRAKIDPSEIDVIIVATVTPDNYCPSVACMVQKNINATNAIAFDINAACTGFVFGMDIGYSMMKANDSYNNILIIGAETLSKVIDWEDRSTCVLFGDGGGAMVLSREEVSKEKYFSFNAKSVGEKGDCLRIGAEDVKNPFIKNNAELKNKKLVMNGGEVFKFATGAIYKSIEKVLNDSNLKIDDIDYIVPHQANYRIIEYTAKKLKIDVEKFYINLDRYGNTSSASIPIALNEMYEKNLFKENMKVILVGFGGGLTYGSALIEL